MSLNELDASDFQFNNQIYIKRFEKILAKISECFFLIKKNKIQVPLNDENGIRDILLNNYLKNAEVKRQIGITEFLFDKETSETESTGRVDIRVMPVNPFISDEAYYIIECKRLNNRATRGVSGLNYKYIYNGIQRFTTGFYSSYYKTSAMIGFIIESLDIDRNVQDVNYLLTKRFLDEEINIPIKKEKFIENFEYHYSSIHVTKDKQKLKLYHLMFNFAD